MIVHICYQKLPWNIYDTLRIQKWNKKVKSATDCTLDKYRFKLNTFT